MGETEQNRKVSDGADQDPTLDCRNCDNVPWASEQQDHESILETSSGFFYCFFLVV